MAEDLLFIGLFTSVQRCNTNLTEDPLYSREIGANMVTVLEFLSIKKVIEPPKFSKISLSKAKLYPISLDSGFSTMNYGITYVRLR